MPMSPSGSRAPSGFAYQQRSNGEVLITHHGKPATVLRGNKAKRFLAGLGTTDAQQSMARLTGQYEHGNERSALMHPRNRDPGT